MANTLTSLIPDIFAALNVVGREVTGILPAITLNGGVERAAVGQTVRIPQAPAAAAEDITPATTAPDTGDQTIDNEQFVITKSRAVPFRWVGEEERGLRSGPGILDIRQQQIAQAIRTLINEMEADAAATYKRASRVVGTAGTTPFGSDLSTLLQARKILVDNGCPDADLQCVIDTTAGVNIRGLPQLQKVNEAGTPSLLRQGVIGSLFNMDVRESAQIKYHTKGTGSAYEANGGEAIGETTIALDTGSGTVLAGDVVSFAGDTNLYVVNTALSGGNAVIAKPGLRETLANNTVMTVGNSYRANMVFHRNAILGGIRLPALPDGGDAAADRITIADPWTGIVLEFAMYPQYRRMRYEVAASWGFSVIKPEHLALIRG